MKPKITITRVPTIDQTENGFLYPLDNISINDQSSPPSSPDHNHSCVTAPAIPERNFASDIIEENVPMLVFLKILYFSVFGTNFIILLQPNGQATFVELHYHETNEVRKNTNYERPSTTREEQTYHFPHLDEIQYASKEIFI